MEFNQTYWALQFLFRTAKHKRVREGANEINHLNETGLVGQRWSFIRSWGYTSMNNRSDQSRDCPGAGVGSAPYPSNSSTPFSYFFFSSIGCSKNCLVTFRTSSRNELGISWPTAWNQRQLSKYFLLNLILTVYVLRQPLILWFGSYLLYDNQ